MASWNYIILTAGTPTMAIYLFINPQRLTVCNSCTKLCFFPMCWCVEAGDCTVGEISSIVAHKYMYFTNISHLMRYNVCVCICICLVHILYVKILSCDHSTEFQFPSTIVLVIPVCSFTIFVPSVPVFISYFQTQQAAKDGLKAQCAQCQTEATLFNHKAWKKVNVGVKLIMMVAYMTPKFDIYLTYVSLVITSRLCCTQVDKKSIAQEFFEAWADD